MKRYDGKYMKVWVKKEVGEAFGDRLKRQMESENRTIKELAQIIMVEPSNVSKWIYGITTPRWYYMRRLADALKCTVDWLITGEEGKSNE